MKTQRTQIVSRTTDLPVTLPDVKEFCSISLDIDDNLLTDMILAAGEKFETYCRRPLLPQVSIVWYDGVPCDRLICLPFGLMQGVDSVKYWNLNGDEATVSSSSYMVDITNDQEGRILFSSSFSFPSVREINSVAIQIQNGWEDTDSIPQLVKEGIKSLVSFWYENREMYYAKVIDQSVKTKWMPFRIMRVF